MPSDLFPVLPEISAISSGVTAHCLSSVTKVKRFDKRAGFDENLLKYSSFPDSASSERLINTLRVPSSIVLLSALPYCSFITKARRVKLNISTLSIFCAPIFSRILRSLSNENCSGTMSIHFLFSDALSAIRALIFSVLPLLLRPIIKLSISHPHLCC